MNALHKDCGLSLQLFCLLLQGHDARGLATICEKHATNIDDGQHAMIKTQRLIVTAVSQILEVGLPVNYINNFEDCE